MENGSTDEKSLPKKQKKTAKDVNKNKDSVNDAKNGGRLTRSKMKEMVEKINHACDDSKDVKRRKTVKNEKRVKVLKMDSKEDSGHTCTADGSEENEAKTSIKKEDISALSNGAVYLNSSGNRRRQRISIKTSNS